MELPLEPSPEMESTDPCLVALISPFSFLFIHFPSFLSILLHGNIFSLDDVIGS